MCVRVRPCGWAEMTEDEKEGYITRAGDDKDPVIAATKVGGRHVQVDYAC